MEKKKIVVCVGTRPNLIKITQLERCFKQYPQLEFHLLHTGQHYDYAMNEIFFQELNIRKPDVFLGAKGNTQFEVMADIMVKTEKYFLEIKPDFVMVPGDVNSTFICGFVANRLGIPIAHIESGLRSFDRTMPEEINRILVDHIADIFFITEKSGIENLIHEGINKEKIKFVGNTMIDTLVAFQHKIDSSEVLNMLNVKPKQTAIMTFHRPANVDNKENLTQIINIIENISKYFTVIFPVHPRTLQNLDKYELKAKLDNNNNIRITSPLGYLDFLKLVKESALVITDSGGIQEETTFLRVPCITCRPNTERPSTIEIGSNILLDLDENQIFAEVEKIANGENKQSEIPPLWDGKASERIAEIIANYFN